MNLSVCLKKMHIFPAALLFLITRSAPEETDSALQFNFEVSHPVPDTDKVMSLHPEKQACKILQIKIKGRGRLSLERVEAVRRPGLINQERLVHGNCDGEELACPWKEWVMVALLLLTHKHRFTISVSSHSHPSKQFTSGLINEYCRHGLKSLKNTLK